MLMVNITPLRSEPGLKNGEMVVPLQATNFRNCTMLANRIAEYRSAFMFIFFRAQTQNRRRYDTLDTKCRQFTNQRSQICFRSSGAFWKVPIRNMGNSEARFHL